ncbi:hypothetical protein LTR05_005834 [Lithohypha guttulata]|uniref:Serine protease n=1 Tax=Lithohypha guttulata TaxID=1690604 RepID=A0AAN7SYD4_9EURO|nr:hypothetical protein LTR05_005834 [Lithohypha guttulata]
MPQVFDDSRVNIADASYATTSHGDRLQTQTLASRLRSDPPRPGCEVAKESTGTRTGTFTRDVSTKTTATKLPRDAYTVLWLNTTSGGYTAAQESIDQWLESPISKLSAICKFGSIDNINIVLTKSLEATEIVRLIKALAQPEYFSNLGIVLVTVPQSPKQAAQVAEERYNVQVTLLGKQKDQAGICKLFFYCEGNPQVRFEGTGFMISRNTLITAGHCVFSAQYGYATKMVVFLGYRAEANGSIKQSSEPEECLATRMGVHKRYHSNAAEANDLAIVEVDPPFSGDVQPFRFTDTLATVTEMLTTVGFPGRDRYGGFKEAGRVMFESSGTVTWNLATNKMLHHRLDTYGGMSGAPVLWDDDEGGMVVIGVHTKWGSNANNAAAINAHEDTHGLGNVITAFMRALLAQADPASQGNRSRRRELTGIKTAVSRLAEISVQLD